MEPTILLVDMSNIYWSHFYELSKVEPDKDSSNLFRHTILVKLLHLKQKFNVRGNQIFLCFDSPKSWRKEIFPYYKARRAKSREKQEDLNFEKFFKLIDEMTEELKIFPFHNIKVERCEGDDIIAILLKRLDKEKCCIISKDADFYQLQLFPGFLMQYDPIEKKVIPKSNDPWIDLQKKILMGDSGDDVPNVRSDDDVFVTAEKRQKPLGPKAVEKIMIEGIENFLKTENLYRNWNRNRRLIDLSKIPQIIENTIIHKYVTSNIVKDRITVMAYFEQKSLKVLSGRLNEFFC